MSRCTNEGETERCGDDGCQVTRDHVGTTGESFYAHSEEMHGRCEQGTHGLTPPLKAAPTAVWTVHSVTWRGDNCGGLHPACGGLRKGPG